MENRTRKVRIGAMVTAVLLLCFALIMWSAATGIVRNWQFVTKAYAAVGVIWVAAAVVMAFSALGLLVSLGRHRVPAWIGGTASLVAGTVWVTGVLVGIVPCSGPS